MLLMQAEGNAEDLLRSAQDAFWTLPTMGLKQRARRPLVNVFGELRHKISSKHFAVCNLRMQSVRLPSSNPGSVREALAKACAHCACFFLSDGLPSLSKRRLFRPFHLRCPFPFQLVLWWLELWILLSVLVQLRAKEQVSQGGNLTYHGALASVIHDDAEEVELM